MQKKIRRLLTIAACATLLSNTGVIAFAADDETTTPTSPSIYGNLIEIKNGTMYANGIDGSTGIIYDVHDSEPYWYSGGENTLYVDGGSLIVHDYVSSSLTNGLLVATSGNVTAEKDGTLTIATNSFIRRDVNLSVIQDATLDITGGEVLFNTGDQIDGKVVVSGGLLEIDNFTRNPSTTSAFEQTGGTITITGTGMDFASDRDSITGGTVNVGQNATGGSLGVSHGYIGAGATVNIFENSSMDVKGGNVTLDAGDTYRGDVTLSSGELKLDSASKTYNATFTQSGGDSIITGTSFDLNNSTDKVTGGDLYIGDGTNTGTLSVTEGTIDAGANVNVGAGSSLDLKGGTVSLDSKDIINGGINVANGTINLDNAEKATTATFVQNGGTTNISGDSFVLNNTSDAINNGNLNIGNDGGSGTLTLRGGSVASETDVNIAAGSEVDIKSGSMSLDSNDTWTGNVNVQGGTLNVKNTDKTGALTQTDGTINVSGNAFDLNSSEDLLDGGTLNIGNGSVASTLTVSNGTITRNEDVYINSYSNMNINGGNVTLDSTDNWSGNVNMTEGDLSLEEVSKSSSGIFHQTGGDTVVTGRTFDLNNDLDYVEGGNFTIGNGTSSSKLTMSEGAIASGAKVDLTKNATIEVSGGDLVLDSQDKWAGNLTVTDGTAKLNGVTKEQEGIYTQTGGITTITGDGLDFNNSEDLVSGGTLQIGNGSDTSLTLSQGTIQNGAEVNINKNAEVNVDGGNLYLNSGDTWYGDVNVTNGGYVSIADINKNALGTLNQTGGNIDITSSKFELNNTGDKISGGTLTVGSGSKSTLLEVSEGSIDGKATVKLNSSSFITVMGNGDVTLDSGDTWNGGVEVNGGNLTLNDINSKNGVLSQLKGTTTINGTGLNLDNEEDQIIGGTLNIGDGGTLSNLTVSKGTITEDASVNVNQNSTLTVSSSGTVELGKTSSINGNIDVQGGTFSVDSVEKAAGGTFTQSGGITTIKGQGFDLNNAKDSISGGTFNIGDGTVASEVNISQGVIQSTAVTNINSNGKLNISGGTVSLGSDDTYNGEIDITDGELTLKSVTKGEDGVLNQTGGITTITGTSFGLDNVYDSVTGGTINIGNGTTATNVSVAGGTITSEATTNINSNATLSLSGVGNVSLDKTDNLDGSINMSGGTLTLDNVDKNAQGTFVQTGGSTTVLGTGFDLNNYQDTISKGSLTIGDGTTASDFTISEGTVEGDVRIGLSANSQLNLSGGTLTFDNKDAWDGDIKMTGGDLTLDNIDEKNGTFTQTKGNTTILGKGLDLNNAKDNVSGGTVNIGDGKVASDLTVSQGTIGGDAIVNLNESSKLKVNGGNVTFNEEGSINGDISVSDGSLTLNSIGKNANSTLVQSGGVITVTGDKFDLNNEGDKINHGYFIVGTDTDTADMSISKGSISKGATTIISEGSTVNVNGGSLSLDGETDTLGGNLNISSGSLELDSISKNEGSTFTQTGGDTSITGQGFSLNNPNDIISGGNVHVGGTVADSSLGIDGGTISSTAVVTVDKGSSVIMSNGTITDGATMNFNDTSKFEMSEGYITDGATVNLNNSSDFTMEKGSITNEAVVNASNSSTINIGQGVISDGAQINLDREAQMNITDAVIKTDASVTAGDTSVINMENGNITKNATVTLDDRAEFNMENGMINEGANLNLNSQSTFNLNGGEIAEDANVSLTEHATINQNNGKLSLNSSDTYSGKINLNGGNLVINGANKGQTGILNQTGGQTQILGNTFDLNNAQDKILGGSLVVGDVNNESTLTISNGTVSKDVETTIYQDSTINLNGGKLALDSADTIEGNLNVTTGRLELDGASKGEYGTFTQTGGETFVTGSGFDLNNEKDNISGGSVVVGGEVANSDLTLSEGSISSSAHVKVDNGSTINVSGGSITTGAKVDIEDTSGLTLTDGSITDSAVINFEDTSNMTMSGGEVSNGASLNFEDESSFEMTDGEIKDKAQVNITENSSMTMTKGQITSGAGLNVSNTGIFNMNGGIISDSATVNLNHEAQMNMADGVVKSGATVNVNDTSSLNMTNGNITGTAVVNLKDRGEFNMEEGTFNDGATLNIDDQGEFNISGGSFASDATMVISEHGKVNQAGGSVELDKSDTFNGIYNMTGGSLTLDEVKKAESAEFTQTGGDTLIIGNTFDLNNTSDKISGGSLTIGTADEASTLTISKGSVGADTETTLVKDSSINVTGGKLALNSTDKIQGNINLSKGQVSLDSVTKGQFGTYIQTDGTTTITGTGFTFNNENDMISGGTVIVGGEVANSEFNLAEGTISSSAAVKVNNGSAINMSGGTITDGASVKVDDTSSFNMTDGDITNEAYMEFNDSAQMNMYDGTISDSAELDFNDEAKMNMSDGTITNNAVLNFQDNAGFVMTSGEITEGAQVNLRDDATMDMTDGEINSNAVITLKDQSNFQMNSSTISDNAVVNMNNESTMAVSDGKIATGATVNMDDYSQLTINGGAITDEAKVNLNDRTSLVLSDGTISDEAVINLNDASSMNVEENGVVDETAVINIGNRATVNQNGGQMTLNSNDTYNGTINMTSGELTIKDIAKTESAVFNQTGGNTTLLDTKFTMNNDKDRVSGGSLNIGTIADPATLVIERGQVDKAASVDVEKDSAIEVNGGSLALDGATDNLAGSLTISKGTLELDSMTNKHSSGVFTQTGGTTNVKGQGFTMNNDEDVISGGIVNIGGDRPDSELAMIAGTIKGDAVINIDNNSNLDVGGTAVVTDGAEVTAKDTSSVSVTGGTITGDAKIYLTDSSELNVSDGEVTYDAYISLGEDATLNQSGGKVALSGTEDVVEGSISISDGELTLNKVEKSTDEKVTYNQTGGKVNLQDSKLALNSPSSKISGGALNLTNSSLDINNSSENSSDLTMVTSDLKLREGNEYTVTGGDIDKESTITVEKNATFAIDGEGTVVRLDGKNDVVEGNLEVAGGTLYISDDLRKVTTADGNYVQTGGNVNLDNSSLVLETEGSKIASGSMSLKNNSTLTVTGASTGVTGGALSIDDTSKLNYLAMAGMTQTTDNIRLHTSGLVDTINGVSTKNTLDSIVVNNGDDGDGQADFAIDINARATSTADTDKYIANTISVSTKDEAGVINISDFQLNGDLYSSGAPIDRHIRLGKIFDSDKIDDEITFTSTDKEIFTPIGYYKLNASSANDGSYSLDLTKFNPQAFRGQVTTAAAYFNQLSVNDSLFNKAQIRRYSPSYGDMFRNRTALIEGTATYDRTMRESEVWVEAIGNFETFKFNNSLDKVRNNSWGMIVGADFGVKRLKRGWSWVPTGYVAYTGGHQTFNGVSAYQNGAQIGFMSSWMKGNFIESALINTGIYGNDMEVSGNSEDAFGYFVGLASKTAYDIPITHYFKIQPALTLSYNMFGKQNFHSDYGNMHMTSGFLNGFNIAPNLNFIWHRENWSAYAQISYAWNLFTGLGGRAGNVELNNIKLDEGYVQYAIGMTKSFSDRLDMYAQATFRNFGRTGVVCQGGLNWRL